MTTAARFVLLPCNTVTVPLFLWNCFFVVVVIVFTGAAILRPMYRNFLLKLVQYHFFLQAKEDHHTLSLGISMQATRQMRLMETSPKETIGPRHMQLFIFQSVHRLLENTSKLVSQV